MAVGYQNVLTASSGRRRIVSEHNDYRYLLTCLLTN